MIRGTYYRCVSCLIYCLLQVVAGIDNPVVIVGGGFAGLAAAKSLMDLGFTNIKVLEASERIGGRVKSVQNPAGTGFFDLGDAYIHGRMFNPVYQSATALGALATAAETTAKNNKKTNWYIETGCLIDGTLLDSVRQMLVFVNDQVLTQSGQSGQTASVGALFDTAYNSYAASQGSGWGQSGAFYDTALKNIQRKEAEADFSPADWHTLSPKAWSAYDEPVNDLVIYVGANGFKPILDDFYNKIKGTNIGIQFKKEVKQITYANNLPVTITMADGTSTTADHVIVTSSLGYLKQNAGTLFSPTLPPAITSAITNIGYSTVDKVFLIYSTAFWPADVGKLYFMRVNQTVPYNRTNPWNCTRTQTPAETDVSSIFWYFETHPTIPNVLEAVISGDTDPKILESASEARLNNAATEALRRFTNNYNVPFAQRVIWSTWLADPLYLGSLSYYTTACDAISTCNAITLQTPVTVTRTSKVTPVVLLAGEATADALEGTAQGAWVSGVRVAQTLSDFYNPPPPLDKPVKKLN